MATIKVWVKKTVALPDGSIEIGLGGSHSISGEPQQLGRERLLLYRQYRAEVERLIQIERQGGQLELEPPTVHRSQPTQEEPPPLSRERSLELLTELQERLAQKARSRVETSMGEPEKGDPHVS
jgi:hypothetical protein